MERNKREPEVFALTQPILKIGEIVCSAAIGRLVIGLEIKIYLEKLKRNVRGIFLSFLDMYKSFNISICFTLKEPVDRF